MLTHSSENYLNLLKRPLKLPTCAFHFVEIWSGYCLYLQNVMEFFNKIFDQR